MKIIYWIAAAVGQAFLISFLAIVFLAAVYFIPVFFSWIGWRYLLTGVILSITLALVSKSPSS